MKAAGQPLLSKSVAIRRSRVFARIGGEPSAGEGRGHTVRRRRHWAVDAKQVVRVPLADVLAAGERLGEEVERDGRRVAVWTL